jgi:hypothetical protein
MHPALQKLFERHVASSFDKQMFLAEVIGEAGWSFDPLRGTISFGQQMTWRVQVLGSVSARTGLWRWSWADNKGRTPQALLKVARSMRRLGEQLQIPELLHPLVARGEATGTVMAMTASGVFNAQAFYRAPFPRGAVYMLIGDFKFPENRATPAVRIPTVLPHVLSRYTPLDHRQALMGYLEYYGLKGDPQGRDLVVRNGTGPLLRAQFDEQDRLTALNPLEG